MERTVDVVTLGALGVLSTALYALAVPIATWVGKKPLACHPAVVAALFLLYLGALWLVGRRLVSRRPVVAVILGFAVLFRALILTTPIYLSSDLYRYLWDGRVQWAGYNPYLYPPAAVELEVLRDPVIHPQINRPTAVTAYPPGAQWLFALAARVAPGGIFGWRLLLFGADILTFRSLQCASLVRPVDGPVPVPEAISRLALLQRGRGALLYGVPPAVGAAAVVGLARGVRSALRAPRRRRVAHGEAARGGPPRGEANMIPFRVALDLLNLVALCGLLLYASNAYVMVALHWRHRRDSQPVPPLPDPLPLITVQLPLFNERYVAARLLKAVSTLDYPRERLEIQVLDDSTDDTPQLVAAAAERLRADGVDVVHLRRRVRTGFKAGALAEGLTRSRGEFIAIFDADFVPPADFLEATLRHFAPDVAVVQTRWGHLNRRFSPLTLAQSLGIDGHFAVEQTARARGGLFLNFNGTAGVWRKAAILDAGGWAHDTLTEDLDLSYRAQLRGWHIVYRPEIVCPAELPVLVAGFKSQQRRWAKGSIQTARKLLPALWRSHRGWWQKYQGTLHLTYYLIHPLMLVGLLLALPLRALGELTPDSPAPAWVGAIFTLATLGPATMLVYAQRTLNPAWWRRAWEMATIMVIGVGVALSTSLAVLGAFFGRGGEFVRTPKFGIADTTGSWRGKGYVAGSTWGGIAELALGGYCAVSAWMFSSDGQYAVAPFLALYAAGFLTVGMLTVVQSAGFRGRGTALVRARSRVGTATLVLGALWLGVAARGEDTSPLVAEGERLWTRSPDPSNPVACATCHWDAGAIRHWGPSFPKFKPLPPPAARVMTLLQANAEAVERHYRVPNPLPIATAITAYLTALGRALPVTPGVTPDQPVFPERLHALAGSVKRGEQAFAGRCQLCHRPVDLAPATRGFPRLVDATAQSLETFLEGHAGEPRLQWDGLPVADLMAYLASQLGAVKTDGGSHQARKEDV